MSLYLEFSDVAKSGIEKAFVRKVINSTLKRSGYNFAAKVISVSFAVIGCSEIKKINRTYRHINEATDVLSFPEYKNSKDIASAGKNVFLGEVVLCYNIIKVSAEDDGLNLEQELARTISHAILHLLGFKHGKFMFEIQDAAADIYLINYKRKK